MLLRILFDHFSRSKAKTKNENLLRFYSFGLAGEMMM